jgi:hypothetical protein
MAWGDNTLYISDYGKELRTVEAMFFAADQFTQNATSPEGTYNSAAHEPVKYDLAGGFDNYAYRNTATPLPYRTMGEENYIPSNPRNFLQYHRPIEG